jgi:hypothetical protein
LKIFAKLSLNLEPHLCKAEIIDLVFTIYGNSGSLKDGLPHALHAVKSGSTKEFLKNNPVQKRTRFMKFFMQKY